MIQHLLPQTGEFDLALKPTRRLLCHQLRVFHGPETNRRAERLVLRFMARGWSEHRIEQLLTRLIDRDNTARGERLRHRGTECATN